MIPFTNQPRAGFLPDFFSANDPRPAGEQLHEAYSHGGGWHPWGHGKWRLAHSDTPGQARLMFPGDPPFQEVARAQLRDETIILFTSDFVAIVQPGGQFDVGRVD